LTRYEYPELAMMSRRVAMLVLVLLLIVSGPLIDGNFASW
jgi:hypothetical protein